MDNKTEILLISKFECIKTFLYTNLDIIEKVDMEVARKLDFSNLERQIRGKRIITSNLGFPQEGKDGEKYDYSSAKEIYSIKFSYSPKFKDIDKAIKTRENLEKLAKLVLDKEAKLENLRTGHLEPLENLTRGIYLFKDFEREKNNVLNSRFNTATSKSYLAKAEFKRKNLNKKLQILNDS